MKGEDMVRGPQHGGKAAPGSASEVLPEGGTAPGFGARASSIKEVWARDTWVKPFFVRYWPMIALALALGVLAFLFASALMFTSGYMISLAAALPLTVLAVHVPSLFVRIFGIGKPVLQYFERLTSHDWALRMTSALRQRLYDVFERAEPFLRMRRRTGEALSALTDDIGHIQDLYLRTILPLCSAWAVCLIAVIALGLFTLPVAALFLVLLVVEVAVLPLAAVCVNGARVERVRAVRARLYEDLTDNVLGVADWMYAGRGEEYVARHERVQEELYALERSMRRSGHVRAVVFQAVLGAAAVLVLAWASWAFGAEGDPSGAAGFLASLGSENAPAYGPNWIAAFVLCVLPLAEAFFPASDAALGFAVHAGAIEHLNSFGSGAARFFEEESAAEAGREAVRAGGKGVPAAASSPDDAAGLPARAASPASERGLGALEFRSVRFRYPGTDVNVLDGLTLTVPKGQKIAVLGRSGAGKSTLSALARGEFEPTTGEVLVAGCAPRAVPGGVARQVGVIQQRPHLFNQTLRENLLVGRGDATDEELRDVLGKVGLAPLAQRLADGLDTMVDEAGRRFSGGERHRIALARVLLAHTPVVLLDEPFAGLDPATEAALVDTMFEALADSTVVMITHHLQGVSLCDRVVFVENGVIGLDGSPPDLEQSSERYRSLLAFDAGHMR